MTDEHNLRTLGCYRDLMVQSQAEIWGEGITVSTPNIDSLAKEGALLSNFLTVSPRCTPSRGSFLTGEYPSTHGAEDNHVPMNNDAITFAKILKDRLEYSASYMGKVSNISSGLCKENKCKICLIHLISSASLISSIPCSYFIILLVAPER